MFKKVSYNTNKLIKSIYHKIVISRKLKSIIVLKQIKQFEISSGINKPKAYKYHIVKVKSEKLKHHDSIINHIFLNIIFME